MFDTLVGQDALFLRGWRRPASETQCDETLCFYVAMARQCRSVGEGRAGRALHESLCDAVEDRGSGLGGIVNKSICLYYSLNRNSLKVNTLYLN